jgi:CBS domain-containing protein
MRAKDIRAIRPVCCTPNTNLQEVARLMVEHDCGEIPVVESPQLLRPVGVVTDRDITCRAVAWGKNPLEMTAGQCMSTPCLTVTPETTLEQCCRLMEQNQVRRLPVIDESGWVCGMVAQADIALRASRPQAAEVVQQVSQPTPLASRVATGVGA